jgi:hypothetical protein
LFNCSRKQQQKEKEKGVKNNEENDLHFVIGCYRLLLEWSLSCRTPLPFQRAIQSNLKTLGLSLSMVDKGNTNNNNNNSYDSNNNGSNDDDGASVHLICRDVLASIWTTPEKWEDPLFSLDVSINDTHLRNRIVHNELLTTQCLLYFQQCQPVSNILDVYIPMKNKEQSEFSSITLPSSQVINPALRIVDMLKALVANLVTTHDTISTTPYVPLLSGTFQDFVFGLLICNNLPSDGFNTLGILYGQLLFLNKNDPSITTKKSSRDLWKIELCNTTIAALDSCDSKTQYKHLSSLARLSMVAGIAATINADLLVLAVVGSDDRSNSSTSLLLSPLEMILSPLEVCWSYYLKICQQSTDPLVRCFALRGLSTLASRWKQQEQQQSTLLVNSIKNADTSGQSIAISFDNRQQQQQQYRLINLIQRAVELVFDSWESPPLRKLGQAIPGLFKALVELMPQDNLHRLCRQVLDQPESRKGRYLALEILLPHIPIGTSDDGYSNSGNPSSFFIPIGSLLEGIGNRGSNAGSIANLWIKVLERAWNEICQYDDATTTTTSSEFKTAPINRWNSFWVPSFSHAILSSNLNRRKQVMAFCIPRIVDLMREFDSLKSLVPALFVVLLKEIETVPIKCTQISALKIADTFDSRSDEALWAQLEVSFSYCRVIISV